MATMAYRPVLISVSHTPCTISACVPVIGVQASANAMRAINQQVPPEKATVRQNLRTGPAPALSA